QQSVNQAMQQRDRWQQRINETNLETVQNPENMLKVLRQNGAQQSEISTLIETAERDLSTAVAERSAHQRRLASDLNDDQIAAVDASGMREFADIAAAYESIRSRRTA